MASPDTTPELNRPLSVPRRPGSFGPVHAGPVLLIAAMLLAPRFLNEYWIFNVCVGLTLGISCLGLAVLTGWARQTSLMHAGVTGAALYVSTDFVARRASAAYDREYAHARSLGREFDYESVRTDDVWVGLLVAVCVAVGLYLIVGLVGYRLGAVYVVVLTFAMQFAIFDEHLR